MSASSTSLSVAPELSDDDAQRLIQGAVTAIESVLRGHTDAVRTLLAAVLGRGHALLEDVPGVGKTTLAKVLAKTLGTTFSRVQFTADMLPSDVVGVQVLDAGGEFSFRPGPVFAQVVLADEINRASPKTQSALLEAMAEGRVTIDDATHALPQPFLVIATQNPVEHHGAYPLPESQLDRFAVSLSLGYPSRDVERALLASPHASEHRLASMAPVLRPEDVRALQKLVDAVALSNDVADYLLALVEGTREHPDVLLGCSPRGAIQYAALARAWAFLEARDYVLPDDVKKLAPAVLAHRLVLGAGTSPGRGAASVLVDEIVRRTPAPR